MSGYMRELSLQEMKEIEFGILKELDSFCKKHHIRYFISHGTLLGAIRYKDFIPWDDDIDVLIPREDFNRLVSLYEDHDQFRLYSYSKNPNFLFTYGKLCDITTSKDESSYKTGVSLGLDVDLFPLDYWADDLEEAKKESAYIQKNLFRLGLTKLHHPDSAQPLKRMAKGVMMAFCKMRGTDHYLHKIMQESVRYNGKATKYVGNKAWNVYREKDIIPAEAFAEAIEIEFHGHKFPAPVGYDTFLSSLYGNYLPEPPKEKQKTHHKFKAYKLED